jgi:hypothetical protein
MSNDINIAFTWRSQSISRQITIISPHFIQTEFRMINPDGRITPAVSSASNQAVKGHQSTLGKTVSVNRLSRKAGTTWMHCTSLPIDWGYMLLIKVY